MQGMGLDPGWSHTGFWPAAQFPIGACAEPDCPNRDQLQLPLFPYLCCKARHQSRSHQQVSPKKTAAWLPVLK